MIRKIANPSRLTQTLRYNYTPVSNYQLQNKINPVVSVTLGNEKETLFDLQFRVHYL